MSASARKFFHPHPFLWQQKINIKSEPSGSSVELTTKSSKSRRSDNKAALKDEFPINAQTGAVTVYKYKYVAAEPCLRCGACSDHCPMGLQPVELKIAFERKDTDRITDIGVESHCNMALLRTISSQ